MPEELEGSPRPPQDADEELRALARLLRDPARATRAARRFERLELLTEGPRGRVFHARDREDQGCEVELEFVAPGRLTGLEPAERAREIQAFLESFRRVHHVAVLRPRDAGVDPEGRVFLVWDLVQGESVRELLDRCGALPPRQAFEIARQVLQGLEALHAEGRVHGGLLPESVGLAARVPWTRENPFGIGVRLRRAGVEGLRGASASAGQDLFSVATLLAECLTGNRLEPDASNWAGSLAYSPTAALSARARELLEAALSRDALARPASARAFRLALERVPEARGKEAFPARSSPRTVLGLWIGALGLVLLSPVLWRAVSAAGDDAVDEAGRSSTDRGATEAPTHEAEAIARERDALERVSERANHAQEIQDLRDTLRSTLVELETAKKERGELSAELRSAVERSAGLSSALEDSIEGRERAAAASAQERAALERELARARAELRAAPAPGPAPSKEPAESEPLERYAHALSAAEPEGRLDLAALGRFRELASWSSRIRADPALRGLPGAREILGFDYARAFYLDAGVPATAPEAILEAAPDGSWREELGLRARLLADSSRYPGPSGARFLYHTRGSSGEQSWRWEEVRREGASWLVEQRFHDASGALLGSRRLRLARAERSFLEQVLDARDGILAEREIVDLARSGPEFTVRTFAPVEMPLPPAALGVPAAGWVSFRASLARSARRALVFQGEPATVWLSSEFGLVRAEHGGRATHELAYAEFPR